MADTTRRSFNAGRPYVLIARWGAVLIDPVSTRTFLLRFGRRRCSRSRRRFDRRDRSTGCNTRGGRCDRCNVCRLGWDRDRSRSRSRYRFRHTRRQYLRLDWFTVHDRFTRSLSIAANASGNSGEDYVAFLVDDNYLVGLVKDFSPSKKPSPRTPIHTNPEIGLVSRQLGSLLDSVARTSSRVP